MDLQNIFLSEAIGRKRVESHEAEDALLKYAVPAARKAGIQIVGLTWGIDESDLMTIPPTVWCIFGFEITDDEDFEVDDDGGSDQGDAAQSKKGELRRLEKKINGELSSSLGDRR